MKQVVEQVLIEESFCVDHLGTYTVKMTIKATKNCIVKLIVKGASAAEITEMTPSIVLTPVLLISDKLDQACQVVEIDIVDSSLKTLFENYLQDIICRILVVLRRKPKQLCQALKKNAHLLANQPIPYK